MNFWQKLLTFFGKREEARAAGLSVKDANKAAATQMVIEEAVKQAAKEEQKAK